jgi:hypothetical protein
MKNWYEIASPLARNDRKNQTCLNASPYKIWQLFNNTCYIILLQDGKMRIPLALEILNE